jgi:hypothetical protein
MSGNNMNVGIGYCNEKDARLSGKKLAETAIKKGNIHRPDLVFAFCHGQLDHNEFFKGLQAVVGNDTPIIGGSAVGIITNDNLSYRGNPAGAAIIQSDTLQIRIASANRLDKDEKQAGKKLAEKLSIQPEDRLLLILYDSIKTPPSDTAPPVMNTSSPLIQGIEQKLRFYIPIIGAGLIGDYGFHSTVQFCGDHIDNQSLVGAMLGGNFKLYYRIMHGCTPMDGIYHTITRAEGPFIYELGGKPIVEVIDTLYGNRDWHHQNPVKLLTIGKNFGRKHEAPQEAYYVNRLITGVLPDNKGIGIFESDLETGMEIQFMLRDTEKMIDSAKKNSTALMNEIQAEGNKPLFGLYIDCAGRTGEESNTVIEEASEIRKVFNRYDTPLFGFYSGVEIAPLLQKIRGLDWTGVLMIMAEKE